MNWLIESKYTTESGYPNVIELNSLDILTGKQSYPTEPCIFRGSIGSSKDLARKSLFHIKNFNGYHANSFDANHFMTEFGDMALNYEHAYLTLGQIQREFNSKSGTFCRPVSGWKPLSGGRLDKDNMFERIFEKDSLGIPKVPLTTLCLVARSRPIEREFRLVVAGNEVIGGSEYMNNEGPEIPSEVLTLAASVLKYMDKPDDVFVLDVGLSNGVPKLIETNAFSTSGLYAANIAEVCERVEKYLLKMENEDV